MQEYFEIGQIVNTSGLKGLVIANLFTDDITKIEEFDKVIIEKNKKQEKMVKLKSKKAAREGEFP